MGKYMLDFMEVIATKGKGKGNSESRAVPDFKLVRSKDLMIKGRQFYALWDEENKLWS